MREVGFDVPDPGWGIALELGEEELVYTKSREVLDWQRNYYLLKRDLFHRVSSSNCNLPTV
jgi:hypothetical protein